METHRYTREHPYSLCFVCVNTLSVQIMTELEITVPLGNSLQASGAAATASVLPQALSGPL